MQALLRKLSAARHIVTRGVRGMGQSPLVSLIAVSTMAVCMLLLGTVTLIFHNAQSVTESWGVDVPVTVYLVEGTDAQAAQELAEKLDALPEVTYAERVSPQVALERLEKGLGGHGGTLEGIDAEALPDSKF